MSAHIGVTGLAVMGANLARNLARNGFTVALHNRSVEKTDTLLEKIELFRSHGRILREDTELFPIMSWLSVMVGQNIIPQRYDPLVDSVDPRKIRLRLEELRRDIRRCVASMPSHWDYIQNRLGCSAGRAPATQERL